MKYICPSCKEKVDLNITINNVISIDANLFHVLFNTDNLEIICPKCKDRLLFKDFKEVKENGK